MQIVTRQEAETVRAQIETCRRNGGFLQCSVGSVNVTEAFDGAIVLACGAVREAYPSSEDFEAAYGLQCPTA